ncbi:NepR family anti-sigma factor [Rhodospirillum sp. A1_3_36]
MGSYLRRAYDDVVAEPLPESFGDLLRQLQEDEGEPMGGSSASSLTGSR